MSIKPSNLSGKQEPSYPPYRGFSDRVTALFFSAIGEPWQAHYIGSKVESAPSDWVWLSEEARRKLKEGATPKQSAGHNGSTQTMGILQCVKKVYKEVRSSTQQQKIDPFVKIGEIYAFLKEKKEESKETLCFFERVCLWYESIKTFLFGEEKGAFAALEMEVNLGGCYGRTLQHIAKTKGKQDSLSGSDQLIALQCIQSLEAHLSKAKDDRYKKVLEQLKTQLLGYSLRLSGFYGKTGFFTNEFSQMEENRDCYLLSLEKDLNNANEIGHAISIDFSDFSIYDINTGLHKFKNVKMMKQALEEKISLYGYDFISVHKVVIKEK